MNLDQIPVRPADLIFSGRREAIAGATCVMCHGPATEFTDELSKKEFSISGLCQKCQDDFFGSDED
jgi:hypothetical protein